jgi:integrase
MATIRKRNDKWHVQVRRSGRNSITKSFLSKSDAQQWAREMEVQADKGNLAVDLSPLRTISVSDLVVRYIKEITPNKKSCIAESLVLYAFNRHPITNKKLSRLSKVDFVNYRNDRLKFIKPNSLKRELNTIQHMFQIAINDWSIPLNSNPICDLNFKFKDVRRERRLEDGEYEKLINAAKTRQNPYILIVIIFATETAMRRGEILNLSWRQVDLRRRCVTILESENGYSRTIPLTPKAYELLQGLDRDHEQVFPLTANALKMAWGRILKVANIEDLHFHDLRHEAVSRFFEMGLTVPEVASISGHRDVRMLLRYAHANTSTLQAKLECQS